MKRATHTIPKAEELVIMVHDPSMTGWGWVVLTPEATILDCGVIKTEPEATKRRIRKGDDTVRRISCLNNILIPAIRKHGVNYMISELPHGSQSAVGAKMIGIVAGMVQTYADVLEIPIEWYSEGDAKKALLGKLSATKLETINAIKKLYTVPWSGIKYKDEAIADAMAIFHAALQQSSFLQFYSKHH